jgi:hypothetical protein
MFQLLREFSLVSKYDEMSCDIVSGVFLHVFWSKMQILVIWNNYEFGVLMNDRVKCVDNQGKNNECMHVKCKYVVIIVWNILQELSFTSTI